MNIPALVFAVTVTLSPFAGIIAYIITYDEYKMHLEKKAAKKQALQTAFFTFFVFVIVGLVAGFGFNK